MSYTYDPESTLPLIIKLATAILKIFLHNCALESLFPSPSAHDKYLGLLLAKEILKIWMAMISIWPVGNEEQKL